MTSCCWSEMKWSRRRKRKRKRKTTATSQAIPTHTVETCNLCEQKNDQSARRSQSTPSLDWLKGAGRCRSVYFGRHCRHYQAVRPEISIEICNPTRIRGRSTVRSFVWPMSSSSSLHQSETY